MKLTRDERLGLALAAVGLLALLLLAPILGKQDGPPPLQLVFGWGAVVLAPALVLAGLLIAFAGRLGWQVRWRAIALAEALFWAVLTLVHLFLPDPLAAALAGRGGGVVGWATAQALIDVFGLTVARGLAAAGALALVVLLWRALPPSWIAPVTGRVVGDWQAVHRAVARWRAARRAAQAVPPRRGPAAAYADPGDGGWAIGAIVRGLLADGRDSLGGLLARSAAAMQRLRRSVPFGRPAVSAGGQPTTEPPARLRRARSQPEAAAAGAAAMAGRPIGPAEPARGKARERGRAGIRPAWLPPYDLLRLDSGSGHSPFGGGAGSSDARQRAQLIKRTLAEFGVPVEVVSIKEGPRVTQFGLEPGEIVRELRNGETIRRRVSVASILRLQNDLALALAAPSLRIEAPVPGRPYVGVEVPNTANTLVSLRNVLETKEFGRVDSPLAIALGRDVSGEPVVADLTRMPHLLIAGATGSGKSVCINAIVCSLLMNNGPETLRMVMVDPKMVELPVYNGIPHLLGPVITETAQATGALSWLMLKMDERYRAFAVARVRNIVEYNRKQARQHGEPFPYIVLIIDELADLMMTAAEDIERQICRLAQMARATGIHLVLATQRPSVDVITGLIKANFPARIAFAVTTQIDSRVILDAPGAEKLLGRGDMLFMTPESSKPTRIQGCFVSDEEIERLVDFWKGYAADETAEAAPWLGLLDQQENGRDELLEQALRLLQGKSHVSTSLLQRQLHIGFPRAARLMEQLEEMGAVGPDEGGGRSRAVLLQAGQGPAEQ
ncbi:MAG: DNA translocase FtsK [Anaerolineae bacterium]